MELKYQLEMEKRVGEIKLQKQQNLLEFKRNQVTVIFSRSNGDRMEFRGDEQKVMNMMRKLEFTQGVAPASSCYQNRLTYYEDSDESEDDY